MKSFIIALKQLSQMKEQFLKIFKENGYTRTGDWLRVWTLQIFEKFIQTFRKMAGQYYPDKIKVCIDPATVPRISMT